MAVNLNTVKSPEVDKKDQLSNVIVIGFLS
jgi:hypothetical protein